MGLGLCFVFGPDQGVGCVGFVTGFSNLVLGFGFNKEKGPDWFKVTQGPKV